MNQDSTIRKLRSKDRIWAEEIVRNYFYGPEVVSRGRLHDTCSLPGLVVEQGGEKLGLLQYRFAEAELEVVILIALQERQGIGSALLEGVKELGRVHGCCRLWLITTNDNREAQAFYKSVGWKKVAIHPAALEKSRELKPEIPLIGRHGIPLMDEIEFEYRLVH